MGEIHDLILSGGVEALREQAKTKTEIRLAETAHAMLSDEKQRVGRVHAGFAMASLPHRSLNDTTRWLREQGGVKLLVESGSDENMKPVGIPYGSVARMILLYLQTEAVSTKSRVVELGRNMNGWMKKMGLDNGGKTYRAVADQSRRISLCRLTFYHEAQNSLFVINGSFVRDAIVARRDDPQLPLWRETVTLDEGFYKSLIDHPLPVREEAIRQIGSRSMAIDAYIWLAYRLHVLEDKTPIPWSAVYAQFGAGYAQLKHFKNEFKEPLALALAAYPQAKVDITDDGLVLHPSPSPVPRISGTKRLAQI